MSNNKLSNLRDVVIKVTPTKLVHGGQALARLEDGRAVFLWNALPGETVEAQVINSKKDFAEAVVVKIIKRSDERELELFREDVRLSTQPWAIMHYNSELKYKAEILEETFFREGLKLKFQVLSAGPVENYRNKVEFGFFGDDDGLNYSHYIRASHKKVKLEYPYNNLIFENMSEGARKLLDELNALKVRASTLKSVIIRSESTAVSNNKVSLALFVKNKDFPKLNLENLVVYYSNPKSPASVPTEGLYLNGDTTLHDELKGSVLSYDVLSFFQVNLPIFSVALDHIAESLSEDIAIDMYSGVGSIGLAVGGRVSTLIELDEVNVKLARKNSTGTNIKVIHASSEAAIEYITGQETVIVDPPRAGLHNAVTERLLLVKPKKIIYLSCNPSTQARDIAMLCRGGYSIARNEAYNFFPRTPHIESLIVLELNA